jgi:monolysocardiolipin acyltransferase
VLGGRENGKEGEIGHLKWGVGKLIAHSPKKAIVIPFTHMGMETVMPQHPVTKVLATTIPQPGHDVSVKFGEELDFDDLIKEHEALHGILWKYTASVDDDKEGDFHEHWDSKPEELVLYHKITLRIEKSLAALLKQ